MITAATVFGAMIQLIRHGMHFSGPHHIIGTLMLFGILPLSLSGAHAYRTKENTEWSTAKIKMVRKVHRRLALLFWLLSLVALTSGLNVYAKRRNTKWAMLAPLNLFAMLLITFGFEARFRWQRKQEDPLAPPKKGLSQNQLPALNENASIPISEKEFEARVGKKEQLCILDDLVLNLSSYAFSHPGGAFTINYLVGRDISKFFYGSYALDGNNNDPASKTPSHAHSNIARKIANRHVVGYLVLEDTQTL